MPTERVHCKLTHPHNVPDGSTPCTCLSECDEVWGVAPHTGEPTKWMRIRDRVFHEDGTPAKSAPFVPTERGAEVLTCDVCGCTDEHVARSNIGAGNRHLRHHFCFLAQERKIRELRAQLTALQSSRDAAERDVKRLDWLDKSTREDGGLASHPQRWWNAPEFDGDTFDSEEEREAFTLRVAIDAQMSGDFSAFVRNHFDAPRGSR